MGGNFQKEFKHEIVKMTGASAAAAGKRISITLRQFKEQPKIVEQPKTVEVKQPIKKIVMCNLKQESIEKLTSEQLKTIATELGLSFDENTIRLELMQMVRNELAKNLKQNKFVRKYY